MRLFKTLALVALCACVVACGNRQKKAAKPAEETADMSQYMPDLEFGKPAPSLELNTPDGVLVSLADYAGKWVVLDFWASWCPDCRAEFQAVKDLYGTFCPKGVEFIGVSFDHDAEAWKNCLDEQGFTWPQVSNLIRKKDNPVSTAYGINWIPTMVLISPDGTVAGAALTAEGMSSILADKI